MQGKFLDGKLRSQRVNLLEKLKNYARGTGDIGDNPRIFNLISKIHEILIQQAFEDYTNDELDQKVD